MDRQEHFTLDVLLANLDRDRLQRLVLRLAQRDPNLAKVIEDELRGISDNVAAQPRPIPPPDLNAVRRQMIRSLHHQPDRTDRGWYIFHLGPEASGLLDEVWARIAVGDGRTAMDMLNAMTDESLENWQAIMEDEEGETLSFVQDELGPVWVEAILSADLTPSEREGWEVKLDGWIAELVDYGDPESFEARCERCRKGGTIPSCGASCAVNRNGRN